MTQPIDTTGVTPNLIAQHQAQYRQFYQGMAAYCALSEAQQDTEEGKTLLLDCLMCAPPDFTAMVDKKAVEMGMLPPVRHRDDQGEPVWTEAEVAQHFEVPLEEVRARAEQLMQRHGQASGIAHVDASTIHSVH